MLSRMMWIACLLLLLPVLACQEDPPLAPSVEQQSVARPYLDPEQIALTIMDSAGWPALDEDGNPIELKAARHSASDKCPPILVDRQVITGSIAHYSCQIRVGPGPYDWIGVHRVVREARPCVPIRSPKSVFMVHGDYKDFVGCFIPGLNSPTTPPEQGAAPYLAAHNVEVWGIELGWALLPPDLDDFGFMEHWDMQRQIDDVRVGLAVARLVRSVSGNAFRPLILVGYSMGAPLGYCYLNDEVQRPEPQRHVKAYIPVDFGVKSADDAFREFICAYAAMDQERMDNGIYQYSSGFSLIGWLARNEPDADSPIVPGLTNLQFALLVGAGPAFGDPFTGHNLAGVFGADGLPTGLQFVTIDQWLDFLESGVPFGATAYELDQTRLMGDCEDLPYDDALSQVTVAVLSIIAGGGLGGYTDYCLDLLGSRDVTRMVVHTSADPTLDFGHIDLFIGANAEMLVWQPMLHWIVSHTGGRPSGSDVVTAD